MDIATQIRGAQSEAELAALLRGARDAGGVATSRADLCAAALEKQATDSELWTAAVAASFGALLHSVVASDALLTVEAAPLAQQLSSEVRSAVCWLIAYMAVTTAVLGAVVLVSFVLKRPFGMFFALNVALFIWSFCALAWAITVVVVSRTSALKARIMVTVSQLHYLALHVIALLGVAACVAYLAMLKTYAGDWCARYAPSAAGSGGNSTSDVAAANAAPRAYLACPAESTAAYASLLAGMAIAALFSCAAFLGALEVGARLIARWLSLAHFVGSDGDARSNNSAHSPRADGYAAAGDAAHSSASAAAAASSPAPVASTVSIATPLSGVTRWVQHRLHISSTCIALNRRDLERMESKAARGCAAVAAKCEALSRRKYFAGLVVCVLVAIYFLADVVTAAVCWSTNEAATCALSNGLCVFSARLRWLLSPWLLLDTPNNCCCTHAVVD